MRSSREGGFTLYLYTETERAESRRFENSIAVYIYVYVHVARYLFWHSTDETTTGDLRALENSPVVSQIDIALRPESSTCANPWPLWRWVLMCIFVSSSSDMRICMYVCVDQTEHIETDTLNPSNTRTLAWFFDTYQETKFPSWRSRSLRCYWY